LELNSADHNPKLTFGGLIERYKLDKLPERYSTRASYLSCLNVHVAPKWGDWTLEQMAKVPYEVEKWFNELTLAPKTKGHIKGLMHRLFECAMKWGLYPIGRNPMELVEIKNVSKRRRQPRVLSSDEFWKLIGFLNEPYHSMVLTCQCLGLRISEVMALKWSDFDFDSLTLRVQRGIVHGRVDDVKTEYSNDDLPLDPEYGAVMLAWKTQCTETPEQWVFPNPSTQRPYWQETVAARQIKPAAIKAGLGSGIGWHIFRHTYRTWLDAAGAPMSIQRELMRHASIQTTMNVYGRATMTDAKRQANSNVVRMALRPLKMGAKSEKSLAALQ
jgi:integrase